MRGERATRIAVTLRPGSPGNINGGMNQPAPVRYTSPEECVEATLSRVGKHVVLGLPVAIGGAAGRVAV